VESIHSRRARRFTHLTFESASKQTLIADSALEKGSSVTPICLPAALAKLDGGDFAERRISTITLEEGNRHFRISSKFLLDVEDVSVIRYFRHGLNLTYRRTLY
jgi:hypothetical protein